MENVTLNQKLQARLQMGPARTLSVGGSSSSERSATSDARASEMRRPAIHCSSTSSLALGLSEALMISSTSPLSASRRKSASPSSPLLHYLWGLHGVVRLRERVLKVQFP